MLEKKQVNMQKILIASEFPLPFIKNKSKYQKIAQTFIINKKRL